MRSLDAPELGDGRSGPEMTRAAGPARRVVVGGPRGSGGPACRWGREGHQKSRGPDLAHGSWLVRKAVRPPAASSKWAQNSRARRHQWVRGAAGGSSSSSSEPPPSGRSAHATCEPGGSLVAGRCRCQAPFWGVCERPAPSRIARPPESSEGLQHHQGHDDRDPADPDGGGLDRPGGSEEHGQIGIGRRRRRGQLLADVVVRR